MPRHRFHGLKKIKIRQTWNKYNLFNLSRLPRVISKGTYYQQKWASKSATRAYHGEQIREGQWERMFKPTARSTVNMPFRYLAENDGSEQARGRGSGLELSPAEMKEKNIMTPYMQMTYAPMERRLDVAIFRALFASSTRQARQMVVHGGVKVNGKKMIYPGYLLNPGDMFQVEPERVLFATGAPKDADERAATRRARKALLAKKEATKEREEGSTESAEQSIAEDVPKDIEATRKEHKAELKVLLNQAKDFLDSNKDTASAKTKQQLRAFSSTVRKAMGNVNKKGAEELDSELDAFFSQLTLSTPAKTDKSSKNAAATTTNQQAISEMSPADRRLLREAFQELKENPVDSTKPYATPWRPRPYMSAFAFIPRYLEVNQNICSAVYLRHPVVRKGLAEVPTPFTQETSQLAFNWYLRRR